MAPKVSQHKFQWKIDDASFYYSGDIVTKIFTMRVFHLDVKCFVAFYNALGTDQALS